MGCVRDCAQGLLRVLPMSRSSWVVGACLCISEPHTEPELPGSGLSAQSCGSRDVNCPVEASTED